MFLVILVSVAVVSVVLKFYFYCVLGHCKSKVCLIGKTALVTGGSAGVGYEIVLGLASRGCRVIVADKNINQSIKDAIIKETNNPNIVLKYVDLASFKSVRTLAEDLNSSEKSLDILINNAGIGIGPSKLTEDNLNPVMQINYYSGFLLTHLLVDLLKASASGRIIFTSSLLCFCHNISKDRISREKINEENSTFYYSDTKLLQIIASDMFAKKLLRHGITSNCFHPFIVKTKIFKTILQGGSFDKLMYYSTQLAVSIFGQSPEDAAQTGIYLACSNEVKNVTGKFFGALAVTYKPKSAFDKKLCEAIWACSEVAVKLTEEEKISTNV